MAEAILAKGLNRPIDTTPVEGSKNLVTSDGVWKAIKASGGGGSVQEVHIGDTAPTNTETVWFDTSNIGTSRSHLLEEDLLLYVGPATKNSEQKVFSSITEAIKQIPTNLNNHDVVIELTMDTNTVIQENIYLSNYFGGTINIRHRDSSTVLCSGNLTVVNCNVKFSNMTLDILGGIYGHNNASIIFDNANINCSNGISVDSGSKFITNDDALILMTGVDTVTAIKANYLSQVYIGILEGFAINGLSAEQGSTISVKDNRLTVSDVMYTTSSGGTILTNAQSTVTSY